MLDDTSLIRLIAFIAVFLLFSAAGMINGDVRPRTIYIVRGFFSLVHSEIRILRS
jgi:hypothetical protein